MTAAASSNGMKDGDLAYQTEILQGVSRTFALTIPQLPAGLRDVVGNAYLLCRITDTIEDEPGLPARQKQALAERFIDVVAGRSAAEPFARELGVGLSASTTASEHDLIANTARVIRITHAFENTQREALARCVRIMAHGMAEFQLQATPDGLDDLPQLDRYCYHVAGVVGEMLTELFCNYSPEIDAHRDELLRLSVSFGQGLQMTNILKDGGTTAGAGRGWLPRDVFLEAGFDLQSLSADHYDPRFAAGNAHPAEASPAGTWRTRSAIPSSFHATRPASGGTACGRWEWRCLPCVAFTRRRRSVPAATSRFAAQRAGGHRRHQPPGALEPGAPVAL